MNKKRNKTCESCKYLCPFVDNGHGNCIIDMKDVVYEVHTCEKYKKLKE